MDKNNKIFRPRLPKWIKVKPRTGYRKEVENIILSLNLNTVCQSAKCPNIGECWHNKTATFMILGNRCTRNCKFCAVEHGNPHVPDTKEAIQVAKAVKEMGLKYVVITSVTRDDLDDGGAYIFAETIKRIREINGENIGIEVLTPDFKCDKEAIKTVLRANPTVFNHNIEVVERLSKYIRDVATYSSSLKVLEEAASLSGNSIFIKSGFMVGIGESDREVVQTIKDLYSVGVRILTIGQYLPPSSSHWRLDRYVAPEKFKYWEYYALSIGFYKAFCGPMVRSSYHAAEIVSDNFS